jgi:hypothetical protein
MQAPSGMFVDHEKPTSLSAEVFRHRAGRLRRTLERALGPVGREAIGCGGHWVKLKRLAAGCVRRRRDTGNVEDFSNWMPGK